RYCPHPTTTVWVAKLNVGELACRHHEAGGRGASSCVGRTRMGRTLSTEAHCTPGFQRPVRQPTGSLVLGKVGLVRCRDRPARWIAAQPHDDRTAGEPRTPHLCWPRAK